MNGGNEQLPHDGIKAVMRQFYLLESFIFDSEMFKKVLLESLSMATRNCSAASQLRQFF